MELPSAASSGAASEGQVRRTCGLQPYLVALALVLSGNKDGWCTGLRSTVVAHLQAQQNATNATLPPRTDVHGIRHGRRLHAVTAERRPLSRSRSLTLTTGAHAVARAFADLSGLYRLLGELLPPGGELSATLPRTLVIRTPHQVEIHPLDWAASISGFELIKADYSRHSSGAVLLRRTDANLYVPELRHHGELPTVDFREPLHLLWVDPLEPINWRTMSRPILQRILSRAHPVVGDTQPLVLSHVREKNAHLLATVLDSCWAKPAQRVIPLVLDQLFRADPVAFKSVREQLNRELASPVARGTLLSEVVDFAGRGRRDSVRESIEEEFGVDPARTDTALLALWLTYYQLWYHSAT